MVRDNSLTKAAEASHITPLDALESSRIVADTASDAIITINEDSKILFVNRAAARIFGYTEQEMLGGDLTMLMPEYLRHLHREGLKSYVATGERHISWEAVELPGRHKSGNELSLELSFGEFKKGGRRFFTGIARDVTRRKQDEQLLAALQKITDSALSRLSIDELLAESLKRIRDVLAVDTVAILLLRSEGDELVAWAAQGLEEEVEYGVRIPVGRGFAGSIVAQGQPLIIEDIDRADVFNVLLREKGIKSLLGVPLLVEGRPTGVLHVGKFEITKFNDEKVRLLQLAADRIALAIENQRLYQVEKTARAEAEAANRAKDEFLTILSHELRTPLTPIIGWTHMMQSGIVSEGDFEKGLSIVSRNAHGLKYLINDLLDMSAILSGKIRLNESYISLEKVLAEAVETMRSYASETLVRLVLEIEPAGEDAFMVKGDRARLNQCFCNVLHNAVKFSPPGSETRIQCEASESQVAVTISDQGQGIPPEFLPHVFERFRQADASRTRAYGGLGLGLALVKSFVSAHGGTIEANSGGKGKGSTFVMHFPHAALAGIENAGAKQLQGSGKKLGCTRLLIVEDQSDTLEMLCEQFRSRGYETVPCTSATEALNLAGHERFDLLISDIAMPGMDGFELIKALRKEKQLEKFPAIALTGYASPRDAEAAIAAGFNLHLSKPIEPTELFAAVESLLHPD